ncbi:MAG TPA: RNase adapter RapZ [Lachnospiraceae bacterium]|nr:RNase adapter RapZ [Lachnospiraceae bacterium]HPF28621.1 RNase adapter RapZ [Lachnospiraceae bacterium]
MRFVIVTGMSGGGKRTAMKMLEDMGYYCVDNLPIPLIDKFVELIVTPNSEISKVALGLDVRADQNFAEAESMLARMKKNGYTFEILFMDASDQVLIKRYKESRRMHPLSMEGCVEDGILKEREILKRIKKKADYIFDTSNLLTRVLKEEMDKIFVLNEEYNNLMIRVVSFGFKYGIPADADLIFDVRFLPNPFYIDELKNHTGNDKPVQDYVMSFAEAEEFLMKLTDMLTFLIPNYVKEGKHQLVIGIGCTGGKHRSVTLANEVFGRLKDKGKYGITITHRDEKLT